MALKSDIEELKAAVGRHFPVYDIRVNFDLVAFYVNVDESTLDNQFEALRLELKDKNIYPVLKKTGGEYVINIVRTPPRKKKGVAVNAIMLVITIFTTVLAGAVGWFSYMGQGEMFSAYNIINGTIYFSVPLLLILGTHEMGHYFMAKKHNVAASLPFFIPSFPPLGTFGAFISIREPIPNKKALFDIGIAGPIAGLIVAIPVTLIGLHLTGSVNQAFPEGVGPGGSTFISFPMLYTLLAMFVPLPKNVLLHPTAFAGWVGLFVTAINLLPAGQLDGGHVVRALLDDKARYISYGTVIALTFFGFFFNYTGWLFFAILIMLLGMNHPPPLNDTGKLDVKRQALGVFAAFILITCFVPTPMQYVPPDMSFAISPATPVNITVAGGSTIIVNYTFNNTGNTAETVDISLSNIPGGWSAWLTLRGNESNATPSDSLTIHLPYKGTAEVSVYVQIPANNTYNATILLNAASKDHTASRAIILSATRSPAH